MTKKKINKEKKTLRHLKDVMMLDQASVAGLIPIKEDFEDTGKLQVEDDGWFKDSEFVLSNWDNVMLDSKQEKYYCERCILTKEYVDMFLKLVKVFFENNKIDLHSLELWECKKKDSPALLKYGNIGMIIAPRVSEEGEEMFLFEDYKEKKAENKTQASPSEKSDNSS